MIEPVTRITSLNNSRIKDVVRLKNRRQRDAKRLTVVEGQREALRALEAGVVPLEAYFCPDLVSDGSVIDALRRLAETGATQLFEVTPAIFEKMAYRGSSGGFLLVVPYMERSLQELEGVARPFLVVIDGAEKPGNVGAILRTADAAGVDGLFLTGADSATDIHNPNVIRASLGAAFTVPAYSLEVEDAIAWLGKNEIKIVAATPEAADLYTDESMQGPVAIVLGSEAFGLSETWLKAADQQVRIPMFGKVDSLNLSVSTALLLYEVVRQRGAG